MNKEKDSNTTMAFPCQKTWSGKAMDGSYETLYEHSEGMTLRDYFAARALSQINPANIPAYKWEDHLAVVAEAAYECADAMLKERNKKKKKKIQTGGWL